MRRLVVPEPATWATSGACQGVRAVRTLLHMPELPEVETIARELRPLVLGATITGFETDWPKAIKHPDPDAFAAGVAGREITEVSRRAKWLVFELSGGMVLAVQVKMTGQVFVLPSGTPRDRHVHLVFTLDR